MFFFKFTEYLSDILEWGPIYTLWSNSEDQLVSALQSMSHAVDLSCNALKELVSNVGNILTQKGRIVCFWC